MDLLMERKYVNETSVETTKTGYTLIDPLVIQTDASADSMLNAGQFSFDLDMDGEEEQLSGLSSVYEFLALYLNNDG
jgi:hypothetical protein